MTGAADRTIAAAPPAFAPAYEAADACEAEAVPTAPCLLAQTAAILEETPDAFAFASGAGELALAYDAHGQADAAAALISRAIGRSDWIADAGVRGRALAEIAGTLADLQPHGLAPAWIDGIAARLPGLAETQAADIRARLAAAHLAQVDAADGLAKTVALPQGTDTEAGYKAVALRKAANLLAKKGYFGEAAQAVDALTMSIEYYRSTVRSDLSSHAFQAGKTPLAAAWLAEAETIARSLEDGYFRAGALRDIAIVQIEMGNLGAAGTLIADARNAAAEAETPNEQARATSRIATRLADAGQTGAVPAILTDARSLAAAIESDMMKGYTAYELAGSAAFAGDIALAEALAAAVPDTPLGSTSSLAAVTRRDRAWALARQGDLTGGTALALQIHPARERVHALSRIIRLIADPDMAALPRYL
jgi:hypothetical protein